MADFSFESFFAGFLTFLVIIVFCVAAVLWLVAYLLWRLNKHAGSIEEPYPLHFLVEKTFDAYTLSGFNIRYRVRVLAERVDDEEFEKQRLRDPMHQEFLADEFNRRVIQAHMDEKSYFFHVEWREVAAIGKLFHVFPVLICEFLVENEEAYVREVTLPRFQAELRVRVLGQENPSVSRESFGKIFSEIMIKGCKVALSDFWIPPMSEELIKRNYNMLTKEQKEAVLLDPMFGKGAEVVAVGLLKHRLDLLQHSAQKHEADLFSVDVEKVGNVVTIKWTLKEGAAEHFLLGFRARGGFSADSLSDTTNGSRVIDTTKDGQVVERLPQDDAYFYTLFLKPFRESERMTRKSLLRFQISVASKAETEAIEATLANFEKRKKAAEQDMLSQALKELGAYVEMDTAFDAMKKSFAEQIEKGGYTEEEKERKTERLNDIVDTIRSKYEPI